MFQNTVLLMIVALSAIQAAPFSYYQEDPTCDFDYAAYQPKQDLRPHNPINKDVPTLPNVDTTSKDNNKNQDPHNSENKGSASKPKEDLNNNSIKDHSKANIEPVENPGINNNSADVANKEKVPESSVNKDSSDFNKAKNPNDINNKSGNKTELSGKENSNKVNGKPTVSDQVQGPDSNKTSVNEDKSKTMDVKRPIADVKSNNTTAINTGSVKDNSVISNNIKHLDLKQNIDTANSSNNENKANLNVKDNKVEASSNASNNINVSSKPGQQNSGVEDLKMSSDSKPQATSSTSVSATSAVSSSSTTTATPTKLPSQENKSTVSSDGKTDTTSTKDKVNKNDGAFSQSYDQLTYGQYSY